MVWNACMQPRSRRSARRLKMHRKQSQTTTDKSLTTDAGWLASQTLGWLDGRIDRLVRQLTDGWTDRRMDRQTD
eukprot:363488-Chlamydomonas_euryale.AAC.4